MKNIIFKFFSQTTNSNKSKEEIIETIKGKISEYFNHLCDECNYSNNNILVTYNGTHIKTSGRMIIGNNHINNTPIAVFLYDYYNKDKNYGLAVKDGSTSIDALCKKTLMLFNLEQSIKDLKAHQEIIEIVKNFVLNNGKNISYSRHNDGKSKGSAFIHDINKLIDEFENFELNKRKRITDEMKDKIEEYLYSLCKECDRNKDIFETVGDRININSISLKKTDNKKDTYNFLTICRPDQQNVYHGLKSLKNDPEVNSLCNKTVIIFDLYKKIYNAKNSEGIIELIHNFLENSETCNDISHSRRGDGTSKGATLIANLNQLMLELTPGTNNTGKLEEFKANVNTAELTTLIDNSTSHVDETTSNSFN